MKTILIVIAGMADLPDRLSGQGTLLDSSYLPALNTLAARGEVVSLMTDTGHHQLSHKNAFLSLIGYDLQRGDPSLQDLMEYGLDNSSPISDYATLSPFVIPEFSGHGVCVTTSAWVRGAAKCAMLKPVDIYSPGSSDSEILATEAELVTKLIVDNEFVLVYVDSPLKASLQGRYEQKKEALENIDRYLIAPIADFVWKSDLLINMAITTDLVTPWHLKIPMKANVPVLLYFNEHDFGENPDVRFTEVEAGLNPNPFISGEEFIRYLIDFTGEP